jgi:hypothetical protein
MTKTQLNPETPPIPETRPALPVERADLLDSLGRHRFFLRFTARDLSDQQARTRTTASALTVGGLIKHVTATEGPGPVSSPMVRPRWAMPATRTRSKSTSAGSR